MTVVSLIQPSRDIPAFFGLVIPECAKRSAVPPEVVRFLFGFAALLCLVRESGFKLLHVILVVLFAEFQILELGIKLGLCAVRKLNPVLLDIVQHPSDIDQSFLVILMLCLGIGTHGGESLVPVSHALIVAFRTPVHTLVFVNAANIVGYHFSRFQICSVYPGFFIGFNRGVHPQPLLVVFLLTFSIIGYGLLAVGDYLLISGIQLPEFRQAADLLLGGSRGFYGLPAAVQIVQPFLRQLCLVCGIKFRVVVVAAGNLIVQFHQRVFFFPV